MTENRSLKWIEYIKVNGEVTRDRERIITELELPIIINGRHFVTAIREEVKSYRFPLALKASTMSWKMSCLIS